MGSFGFSTSRTTLPFSSCATPNICGIRHAGQQDLRGRLLPLELADELRDALVQQVVAQYITNGSSPMKSRLILTACARPRGASCSICVT